MKGASPRLSWSSSASPRSWGRSTSNDLDDDVESGTHKGRSRRPTHKRTRVLLALAAIAAVATLATRVVAFAERERRLPKKRRRRQRRVRAFNASVAYDHLVMVAGHAVTMTESLRDVERRDSKWYLLSYQRDHDVPENLVAHIRRGVEVAAKDPKSLLLFSGGQTRADAGPRSEAQAYFFVAEHFRWFGHPEVAARAGTEEFARDSFENLLFSLCRFAELTGAYPRRSTVVSFDFKQRRFRDVHRAALRFPAESFAYEAMPPTTSRFDVPAALAGEAATVAAFQRDPYGCGDSSLAAKRLERDPFRRGAGPYRGRSCPRLDALLAHCGPALFNGSLPWSAAASSSSS